MRTTCFFIFLCFSLFHCEAFPHVKAQFSTGAITPNNFSGSDIVRIQSAIDSAKKTTGEVVIPRRNANGTHIWTIDSAIRLPSDITVILNNCVIELSDSSRDNLFRSDNVGRDVTGITWNKNISIIGVGDPVLKGADNPRSTGDAGRTLSLNPSKEENWRVSYGSDAGKKGRKQKGDWRNILILMAYVDGFKLRHVTIRNSHAWAVSFERTVHADISDITFELPEVQKVNGQRIEIHNRDGIDLRQGCKFFQISNISGNTEDDFIALSNLGTVNPDHKNGDLNSTMITEAGWHGPEDDIEQITIVNVTCRSNTRAIAIRASDSAGIHDVFINGVTAKTKYNGLLIGNQNYGKPSLPGRINNIHAMNLIGNGKALILILSPITDCVFMNGIYTGKGPSSVSYKSDKTKNVKVVDLVKSAAD